jgi:uncharacterized membrane protein
MSPESDTNATQIEPPSVRQVSPAHVLRWLKLGWRDFVRAGWPSFLHGLIVFIASIGIVQIALLFWPLLPGAVSGFVLVGPILATGLYALSQRLEQEKTPRFKDAVTAWRRGSKCLFRFGILLVFAGAAWVAVTAVLFHFFVKAEISQPQAFLHYVLVQNEQHFFLWAILGGLGAALVFGLTVVSVPLLLDRDIDTRTALLTSMRAVGDNPVTMLLWALFILVATGFSIITLMLGFVVLYPVMGHASWHVYRDLVDAQGLTPRRVVE